MLVFKDFGEGMHFDFNEDLRYVSLKKALGGHKKEYYISGEPPKDGSCITIKSEDKKIIIKYDMNFYHFLVDNLGSVLGAIDKYKNIHFVIDGNLMGGNIPKYNNLLIYILKKYNQKYTIIEKKIDYLCINNFSVLNGGHLIHSLKMIEEKFSDILYTNEKPYKKVYISRRKNKEDYREINKCSVEYRIDDEYQIEDKFKKLGFDIVYTNEFNNIFDQIAYFRSVRVLAGLTGAGLTNAIFMQNGMDILEIETGFDFPDERKELHMHYKIINFYKGHRQIIVPNKTKTAEEVVSNLEGVLDIFRQ